MSNFLTLKLKYVKGPEVCNLFSDGSKGKKCMCVRERRGETNVSSCELGKMYVGVLHCSCSCFICLKLFQMRVLNAH